MWSNASVYRIDAKQLKTTHATHHNILVIFNACRWHYWSHFLWLFQNFTFWKGGVCRLDGHWEANYKLWSNPIGCILLFTQLLLYVGIYLLDNPVINRQKKIGKSQVLKFHQKIGKKIGIIWLFIQLITVNSGGSTYKSFRCMPPPPNRTKFYHFYICFHQKVPVLEVGAPSNEGWHPPNGKSWIHPW